MDNIPLFGLIGIIIVWNSILSYLLITQRIKLQKIHMGSKKGTIIDVITDVLEVEKNLSKNLSDIDKKVEGLLFDSQFYIQKIGLVRFNPFNDTGGDQSFILALVDEVNSGVVISGLHTRNGTRWYAKKVQHGVGVDHELSSDELKAIKTAKKQIK